MLLTSHTHTILFQHLTPMAIHARHGHELRKTFVCQVLFKLHLSVPVMNTFKHTWRSPLYNRKTILYWSFRYLSIYSTVTSHILSAKVTAVLHFCHIQFVSVSNPLISEPSIIKMLAWKLSRYSDWLPAGPSGNRILVGEIFRTSPDRLRGPRSHLYNGFRVFPTVKCSTPSDAQLPSDSILFSLRLRSHHILSSGRQRTQGEGGGSGSRRDF